LTGSGFNYPASSKPRDVSSKVKKNYNMDTDDLSTETYKAVIIEAEKFNHDLTLQFGVLASSCKDEKEYLAKVREVIKYLRGLDNNALSDIFFGIIPKKAILFKTLDKILENIINVEKIPENKRTYDF